MLIKEYRIPLPMSVDEYRIAQLYMIQVGTFTEADVPVPKDREYRISQGTNLSFGPKGLWSIPTSENCFVLSWQRLY